jgi:hypothetical protein
MTNHLDSNNAEHTPFAEPYIGRHRAPEPASRVYYAPARTMGTLAELVGPVEENRTSIIDISDRIGTEKFERVEDEPTEVISTGAHRAPFVIVERERGDWINPLILFAAACFMLWAAWYRIDHSERFYYPTPNFVYGIAVFGGVLAIGSLIGFVRGMRRR